MNFLEAICRLTYNKDSAGDRGTAHYFRNLLNAGNVKGEVHNEYRPFRLLYYTILDAMCCALFLQKFDKGFDDQIPLPDSFAYFSSDEKIDWLNNICKDILEKNFLESEKDIMKELREILTDDTHPENYHLSNIHEGDGRVKCHYCDKTYVYVGSLRVHAEMVHNAKPPPTNSSNTIKYIGL